MNTTEPTEASQYLITLARQIARAYSAHPALKAIILTGSAAEGLSDTYSDLDMIAYYDALPSEEELQAAVEQNQGTQRRLLMPRSEAACMETYQARGVECQVAHITVAQWEQEIATVLEQLDVTSPLQKAFSGMLNAIALTGESLVQKWQERLVAYPDALAEAMIAHYLNFVSPWALYERLRGRDTTIWWFQLLVDTAFHLLGVLAGLNRCYYTPFQFKRMRLFIAQLEMIPPHFADRLEMLFHTDPASQNHLAHELTAEVVALVEQRMPQIDTAAVRHRLSRQARTWAVL